MIPTNRTARKPITAIEQEAHTFENIANLIDSDYLLLSKDFIKQSKNKVVFPKPNELQIDIDSEEAYQTYLRRIKAFKAYYNCSEVVTPSKSGLPKRHIVISVESYKAIPKSEYIINGKFGSTAKSFSNVERVAWQAILGSDPARELLSLIQIEEADPSPVLFEEIEINNDLV